MSEMTSTPVPILHKKRHIAVFVAYKKTPEGNLFFLQMRDGNAPTNANCFSMFGGGIEEGEDLQQAFVREVQEELEYTPIDAKYFLHSDTGTRMTEVFIEEVGPDFEQKITVNEGLYGKFLSFKEIRDADNVSFIAKTIIWDLEAWLNGTKI